MSTVRLKRIPTFSNIALVFFSYIYNVIWVLNTEAAGLNIGLNPRRCITYGAGSIVEQRAEA